MDPFVETFPFFCIFSLLAVLTWWRWKKPTTLYTLVVVFMCSALRYLGYLQMMGKKVDHSIANTILVVTSDTLAVFAIPPLLFPASLAYDFRDISGRSVRHLLYVLPVSFCWAVLKVVIYAVAIGFLAKLALPYHWPLEVFFFLGATLNATDPALAIDFLGEGSAHEGLRMFLEFTALLTCGPQTVTLDYFESQEIGDSITLFHFIKHSTLSILFGAILGFVVWLLLWCGLWSIARFRPHTLNQNCIIDSSRRTFLISCYAAFITSFLAVWAFDVSPTFAIFTLGILSSSSIIKPEMKPSVNDHWAFLSLVASTMTYAFSGLVICDIFLQSMQFLEAKDGWNILVLYLLICVVELIVALCPLYVAHHFGYRLTLLEKVVIAIAEIEGSDSLITILSLASHTLIHPGHSIFRHDIQAKLRFFVAGVTVVIYVSNFLLSRMLNRLKEKLLVSYQEHTGT